MRVGLFFLCVLFWTCETQPDLREWQAGEQNSAFKQDQLRYERVRQAYVEAERSVQVLLLKAGIRSFDIDLYVRAFKTERELEVWAKAKGAEKYQWLKTYDFCHTSGTLGPKRIEGDGQIPEGFYHINHYNPSSQFLLSLKINYPNASDRLLSDPNRPGDDIYLHGGCATIGCIPITNAGIQELYLLTVEAKKAGENIPVHIFPARFSTPKWQQLQTQFPRWISFWQSLKKGYDYFEAHHRLPKIRVTASGEYRL